MLFFYQPVKRTVDPQINMDWGVDKLTATREDYISIRWTGKLKSQYAEVYTFILTTDDGAQLWVDDIPIISKWDSFCNETKGTIELKANQLYKIRMDYKEVVGTAYAQMFWMSENTPRTIVPSSLLYYESQVLQSPFHFIVSPGEAESATCSASGTGLFIATAGSAAQVTINANDKYGNPRGTGGDLFSVEVYPPAGDDDNKRPVHAAVVDNTDSSYSVEYTAFTSMNNSLVIKFLFCERKRGRGSA